MKHIYTALVILLLSIPFLLFQNCNQTSSINATKLTQPNAPSNDTNLAPQKNTKLPNDFLGHIFYHDGDFLFEQNEADVYGFLNYLKRLPFTQHKTICVNAFTGVRYYYSGKPQDEYKTLGFRDDNDPRIKTAQQLFHQNRDPLREFAQSVKNNKKQFLISFRVADAHYLNDSIDTKYPWAPGFLTKKIVNNQSIEKYILNEVGFSSIVNFKNALNFSNAEIHDHVLNEILETIDRYQDVIDGFEVDFTRFPIFFKSNEGFSHKEIMTSMIRQIRTHLTMRSDQQKRPLALVVRVSPTIKANLQSGLDVEFWMKTQLVDFVIPSRIMTPLYSIDESLLKLSHETQIPLYYSLMGRLSPGDYTGNDFLGNISVDSSKLSFGEYATNAMIRNSIAQGYSFVEVYNWQFDQAREDFVQDLFNLRDEPNFLIYSIDKMYYDKTFEEFYQSDKIELPSILEKFTPQDFTLNTAFPFNWNTQYELTLRIGLSKDPLPNRLDVSVNGVKLGLYELKYSSASPNTLVSLSSDGDQSLFIKPYKIAAEKYIYFPLLNPQVFKNGKNTIQLMTANRIGVLSVELMVKHK